MIRKSKTFAALREDSGSSGNRELSSLVEYAGVYRFGYCRFVKMFRRAQRCGAAGVIHNMMRLTVYHGGCILPSKRPRIIRELLSTWKESANVRGQIKKRSD